jgi:hypothetical protein
MVPREEVREELLAAAEARKTVTYGLLMRKFKISRGHPAGMGIVGVISAIDRVESEREAPGFAALVVRKDTGYPGGGYFCYDDLPLSLRRPKSQSAMPRLSEAEKRFITEQREKIWRYYSEKKKTRKRWNSGRRPQPAKNQPGASQPPRRSVSVGSS